MNFIIGPFLLSISVLGRPFVKPSSPSQRGTAPIQFSVHICCGQMAGWIKMPLGMEVGLGPGDFVLDGDPAPLPKKGPKPPPQFSDHAYCGQTAGWIKMALGTEVDLGRPHCARWESSSPPPKRGQSPQFWAHF